MALIRRSGQEVLVHTEREAPVAFVGDQAATARTTGGSRGNDCARTAGRGLRALQVLVDRFHADVEALGHVPLQPGADAPERIVVVAAGCRHGGAATETVAEAFGDAQDIVRRRAV